MRQSASVSSMSRDGGRWDAVVAIDGTSGSGKSTTAKAVAKYLHGDYVDTGAMYRAVTWWMLRAGVDVSDSAAVENELAGVTVAVVADPEAFRVLCNGIDISSAVREVDVTEAVSSVAAVPAVRERLCAYQRGLAEDARRGNRALVMEGRDIGSVVLPDADVKVWLQADIDARASRRAADGEGSVAATTERLIARDARDASRAISPAQMAGDAVLIDTTFTTVDAVVDEVLGLVARARTGAAGHGHG